MSKTRKKRNKASAGPTSRFVSGLVLCAIMVAAWQLWADSGKAPRPTDETTATAAATYGNLLDVVTDSRCLPDQRVSYTGMDLSFNPRHHVPNWVAWELTRAETEGTVGRENKFYCDEHVAGCADHYDYSYSGYDRGHMAPAGDMKWSADAMHGSFSMANICPQAKSLNTGAWKKLEDKCRTWARADSAIIVICGPILTERPIEQIGDSRVSVPRRFFKVILSPHVSPMRGIGFVMPNDKVPGGIQAAAVSIDEVERLTGHDFFASLPDDIENEVESQCDFHYWSTHK